MGGGLPRYAYAEPATAVGSPYGALGAYDARGIALPPGFTSREIARAGQAVASTGYVFPAAPDGQGTIPALDGGWYLCTNSEQQPADGGGVSVIKFSSSGSRESAQRLVTGGARNCSSGVTPWGTYLSCEEVVDGQVWEADPTNPPGAVKRPALGSFNHEAACVDPVREQLYLTEDQSDGCLYRFTPTAYPDLTTGLLEVALVAGDNSVTWQSVPFPNQVAPTATRYQVAGAARFNGGEGMWYDDGVVYFTTKGDRRVWMYNAVTAKIEVLYDLSLAAGDTPLREVDNITVSKSGDVYICEDGDNFEICIITPDRYISAFVRLDPAVHGAPGSNECTGVVFDPGGTRMYFTAQRSFGSGAVYEVTGPFRLSRPAPPVVVDRPVTPAPPAPADSSPPPSAPPPPAPLADLTAPRVTILALLRRLTVRRFLTRGLSVQLDITEPAGVELVLRAKGFGVLARKRTTVALQGRVRLRLRLTRPALRRRLRRRRRRAVNAQLTVRVTDAAGNATTLRRTVKINPPR